MTPVENILARLEAGGFTPRPSGAGSGAGWIARCPAHDDRQPSLSVGVAEDGKVLVHCHAGCETEWVVGALGLTMADLMPGDPRRLDAPQPIGKSKTNGKPQTDPAFLTADAALQNLRRRHGNEAAAWEYYDAAGELVGVVCRWNLAGGKEIRPVSLQPDGWRITAMPTPRPLYRLRKLLKADRSKPVFIVEGEKTADAAARCGLLAVTSAGGAQAANKADWKPLAGRRAVIVPDNDKAGEKYADDVAKLCYEAGAAEVRILRLQEYAPELPEGGDLADVLESPTWCGLRTGDNATPETLGQLLLRLVEDAPELTPELPDELNWEPFPTAALPEPVRSFVERAATALVCDTSYVALPALTVCAAAIGNTRCIELKGSWRPRAILWTAIVGESGTVKTPAFRLALQPVRDLEQKAQERHEQAMRRFDDAMAAYEKAMAEWKRAKNDTDEPPEKPEEPQAERFTVGDATIESIAPILKSNPRGLLLARDELNAWLGSFDRYATRGGADAANWLSMHVGETVIVDRKTGNKRTLYIPNAAVSITGGIQPGILRRVINEELREAGLLARLLLACPPRRAKQWSEAVVDSATKTAFAKLIETLYSWQAGIGEDGKPRPMAFKLSPEAKTRWIDFYNVNAKEQAELDGDLASAWSKLEEYAARLALVVHCIRIAAGDLTLANADLVDIASMEAGIVLAEWFKREARRVYAMFTETDEDADRRRLVEWIASRGGAVTVRDVTHGLRRFRNKAAAAEDALNDLAKASLGRWEAVPAGPKGGRLKSVFRLASAHPRHQNPSISGVSRGFGDGDDGDESEMVAAPVANLNPMPPISVNDSAAIHQALVEVAGWDTEDAEWMTL